MAAKSRLYRVIDNEGNAADRLVEAGGQAQAIRHVARERYEARVATQHEIVKLVSTGVLVEVAGADNAE